MAAFGRLERRRMKAFRRLSVEHLTSDRTSIRIGMGGALRGVAEAGSAVY
jgi:hypothetical protein